MINGQNFFGIHEQALEVHTRRSEIIANNLANESTPNYLSRDLDFREILNQAQDNRMGQDQSGMQQTHGMHLPTPGNVVDGQLKYRTAMQPSLDGNTVDGQLEHAAFSENALRYLSNVTFMSHHLQRLNTAITGGNR